MPEQRLELVQLPAEWRRDVDLYLAGTGQGYNTYIELRRRLPELAQLYALDDTALFALGILRQDIPAYVFRDLAGDARHQTWR